MNDELSPTAPDREGQEWANALTHGISSVVAITAGVWLVGQASAESVGLSLACAAYTLAASGTFLCSTLSHSVKTQPLLDSTRAWDQAMIYLMIAGTYSPIANRYLDGYPQLIFQMGIWGAASIGVLAKLALRHRINSVTTLGYLLLGWIPAIPLASAVPNELVACMLTGGVVYTIGVVVLINDARLPYLHAVWHLLVMAAASVHFWGIYCYVVQQPAL